MKYDFKYAANRIPFIAGVSPARIDDCFRVLQEAFGIDWLETIGTNRIQQLWKQPYHLATVELYSLGHAIKRMLIIDPVFTKEKIDEIKSADTKTQNGAFFELFALNSFSYGHQVIPAKGNNPGYDGTVEIADGNSFRLSVKNYSISVHHDNFLKSADEIRTKVEEALLKYGCPPLEIIITHKTGYPATENWKKLAAEIGHVLATARTLQEGKLGTLAVEDWGIILKRINGDGKTFSNNPKSYTLIINSPFHKNEEKNLHDKLEEACANLVKHSREETATLKNFVIVHLPKIASREKCEQWAKDYFNMYPGKPISGIILYQPLVTKDKKGNGTYISNGMSVIIRPGIAKEFLPPAFRMGFPVGMLERPFGEHAIFIQTSKDAIKIELKDFYIYQHGDHYYDATNTPAGLRGEMNKVASGVFQHAVMNFGKGSIVLSGQYEPVDTLEIL